jgi:hypothetical protein
MKILVNGCSFTSGEESSVAWPQLIPDTVNIAVPGASNDYILHSTVDYIKNVERPTHAIIAWTSPNRIEISNKHLTPTSESKYGKEVIQSVFDDWDIVWARSKFLLQAELLHGYLMHKEIPHVFVSAFDIQSWAQEPTPDHWLGWPRAGMVEWMWDCPKGSGGHPLELGHQRIAEKIHQHIKNLDWFS